MGENSNIEWTDHTFNIVWGCTKVSQGCKNCYADTLSARFGHNAWGPNAPRKTMSATYWRQPIRWNLDAATTGVRRRVFCSSMADVFEDHPTTRGELARLWPLIRQTTNLDWLLLTKRAERIAQSLPEDWGAGWPNVWLGVSVEDQARAEERIPNLLRVPAAVRFLSAEPLLGRVDLDSSLGGTRWIGGQRGCAGVIRGLGMPKVHIHDDRCLPGIDWVICGGESGPKARPMHPDWARGLRDQCQAAGVPYFFKQWGEWAPVPDGVDHPLQCHTVPESSRDIEVITKAGKPVMHRVGKKAAGRVLDGRVWDEVPSMEVSQ